MGLVHATVCFEANGPALNVWAGICLAQSEIVATLSFSTYTSKVATVNFLDNS